MNYISFNIRGLGGGPKRAAFKRILDIVCPVIVFLQETMSSGDIACDFFLNLRPGWFVSALDACGHYGGTLVGWNPLLANLRAFKTCVGLLLKGSLKGFDGLVHLLNEYGPYSNRM